MRFSDVYMGLMGLEVASRGMPGWLCSARIMDSSLGKEMFRGHPNPGGGDINILAGYFEHRDLVLWASNPSRGGRAADVLQRLDSSGAGSAIFVGTRSVLTAQKGYAFLRLLDTLVERGFAVCWARISAVEQGLPHDAHYTVVVATRTRDERNMRLLITDIALRLGLCAVSNEEFAALTEEAEQRRPRLGTARSGFSSIPSWGYVDGGRVRRIGVSRVQDVALGVETLREIVAPRFFGGATIRAVRLISRGGVVGVAVKDGQASYAMGPGVSACPLFAVRIAELSRRTRTHALEYANWTTERDGWLVWRLRPERAVLLHGPEVAEWERPLGTCAAPLQSKYALVAQGCPPAVLRPIAEALESSSRAANLRGRDGECAS